MANWEKYEVPDWVVKDRNRRLNDSSIADYNNHRLISSAEFMKELEERAIERKKNRKKNSSRTEDFVCSVILVLVLMVVFHMLLF